MRAIRLTTIREQHSRLSQHELRAFSSTPSLDGEDSESSGKKFQLANPNPVCTAMDCMAAYYFLYVLLYLTNQDTVKVTAASYDLNGSELDASLFQSKLDQSLKELDGGTVTGSGRQCDVAVTVTRLRTMIQGCLWDSQIRRSELQASLAQLHKALATSKTPAVNKLAMNKSGSDDTSDVKEMETSLSDMELSPMRRERRDSGEFLPMFPAQPKHVDTHPLKVQITPVYKRKPHEDILITPSPTLSTSAHHSPLMRCPSNMDDYEKMEPGDAPHICTKECIAGTSNGVMTLENIAEHEIPSEPVESHTTNTNIPKTAAEDQNVTFTVNNRQYHAEESDTVSQDRSIDPGSDVFIPDPVERTVSESSLPVERRYSSGDLTVEQLQEEATRLQNELEALHSTLGVSVVMD